MIRISFKKAPILIGAFFLFFCNSLMAQNQWNKVLGVNSIGKGLLLSDDTMTVLSFEGDITTNLKVKLTQYDLFLNEIRTKSYFGLPSGVYPKGSGQLSKINGIYAAISTNGDSTGYIGGIQLLDSSLDSIKRLNYRFQQFSTIIRQSLFLSDSSNVAIGTVNDSLSTIVVVKLDFNNQVLWELLLPELYSYKTLDFPEQILATSDGNYLVSGKLEITEPFSNLNRSDPFLYKVAPNGTLLWGKRYGGIGSDSQGYVQELNGYYYYTYSEQVGNAPQSGGNIENIKQVFLKLDTNGLVLKKDSVAYTIVNRFSNGLIKTQDNHFVINCQYGSTVSELTKVDTLGNVIFNRRIYNKVPASSYIYDLAELSDGSLVGTGWFVGQPLDISMAYGGYTWLFKTDSEGCLVPNCGDISNIPAVTSIEENVPQLALRLGPNPARDVLYVAIASPQDQLPSSPQLRIINLQGQVVHEAALPPIGNLQAIVPVQHLPRGLYIVEFFDNQANWRLTQKVVLE